MKPLPHRPRMVGTTPVLRVESRNMLKFADHVITKWNLRVPAKKGDVVLARFWARAEYARQESGNAMIKLAVYQHQPSYRSHVKLPLTAGST